MLGTVGVPFTNSFSSAPHVTRDLWRFGILQNVWELECLAKKSTINVRRQDFPMFGGIIKILGHGTVTHCDNEQWIPFFTAIVSFESESGPEIPFLP